MRSQARRDRGKRHSMDDRGHGEPAWGPRPVGSIERGELVGLLEEVRAVWDAAGGMGYPWGPCYRLILLTGDRRGE